MKLFSFLLLLFCSQSLLQSNEIGDNYTINKNLQSRVKLIITDTSNNPISDVEIVIYQDSDELGRGKTNKFGEVIITCTHSEDNAQVTIKANKKDYQKINISAEIHTPITSFSFIIKKSSKDTKDIKLNILMEDKEIFKDDSK